MIAFQISIQGSLNIFAQAEKAGVRNFAYTSSIIAHSDRFFYGDTSKITEDRKLSYA